MQLKATSSSSKLHAQLPCMRPVLLPGASHSFQHVEVWGTVFFRSCNARARCALHARGEKNMHLPLSQAGSYIILEGVLLPRASHSFQHIEVWGTVFFRSCNACARARALNARARSLRGGKKNMHLPLSGTYHFLVHWGHAPSSVEQVPLSLKGRGFFQGALVHTRPRARASPCT